MLTTRWGRRQQVEPKPDVRTVLGPFMALKHNPSLMLKLRAAQRTAYRRIRISEPHGPVDISRSTGQRGAPRSADRRVGKECVRTCRSRWRPDHSKKKKQ